MTETPRQLPPGADAAADEVAAGRSRPARDTGPGDRRPLSAGMSVLERAPGERYAVRAPGRPAASPAASRRRALAAALAVATGGTVVYLALGLLDLGPGLIAVAAGAGWATAVGYEWGGGPAGRSGRRATRVVPVAGLAVLSILAGQLLVSAWALGEGGVLGPVDYLVERFGFLAVVAPTVAGVAGGLRAR